MRLSSNTEWLFFHLWKKNPDTNSSCPGVFIADTVIYRWAKPFFYYFTTKDGQILRKTKERVQVENFEQVFVQNADPSGVVSLSMTSCEIQNSSGEARERIDFEYFTKESLKDFLYQREKTLNGIVQKFIAPKNNRNSLIKVSWSPQFCLLQRKTNIHRLDNSKISLNDRLATFEGSEYLSENDSIQSPILSQDIEQICINIVKHIQDVSGGNIQISRMVLYFKLDDKNRLWLLFCTGLKVREKYVFQEKQSEHLENKNINQENDRLMSPLMRIQSLKQNNTGTTNIHNKVTYTANYQVQKLKYENDTVCANCQAQKELYRLKFRHVVESFENGILDEISLRIKDIIKKEEEEIRLGIFKKKKKDNLDDLFQAENNNQEQQYGSEHRNIPGLILKVWGNLTEKKYFQLIENDSWLELYTKVCDDCYVKFTQITIESKEQRLAKEKQYVMKISKKPEEDLFQLKATTPRQGTVQLSAASQAINLEMSGTLKNDLKMKSSQAYNKSPQRVYKTLRQQTEEKEKESLHPETKKPSRRTQSDFNNAEQPNDSQDERYRLAIADAMEKRRIDAIPEFSGKHYARTSKSQKNIHQTNFDPSRIYGQKNSSVMPITKLPPIKQNSFNSFSSTSTQISKHGNKNSVEFMMNTIKDLKNILNQEFSVTDQNNTQFLENSHNSSILAQNMNQNFSQNLSLKVDETL